MITLYLTCFVVGLVLSLLAAFSGLGHLHLGHFHLGHAPAGHVDTGSAGSQSNAAGAPISAVNGFTLAAFLCWFGGAGYLLERYSSVVAMLVMLAAVAAGLIGAVVVYGLMFKLLLPCERVMSEEDTRMEGTLACVSNEVRAREGIGEILFSQTGARRSAAARSEDGSFIARGTDVVVLRYEHGIAYVRPLDELPPNLPDTYL